jgi:Zn-dependent peptidase ImmA (M78 family)
METKEIGEKQMNNLKRENTFFSFFFHEVKILETTQSDFEVSLSAKHRRLLKINRFKNTKIKIKLQEKNKYLKN